MYIMKSRGMKHSNQVREFIISDNGIDLVEVYLGPDGILTGSARESQKLTEKAGEILKTNAVNMKDREINRKRKVLEAKIAGLQTEFESAEEELNKIYVEQELMKKITAANREEITKLRRGES
jgi:circadian clock protein KaiC